MNLQTLHLHQTHILYDQELVPNFTPELFAPALFAAADGVNRLGRGAAYLFEYQGVNMVLRHYQRGGWMRFINSDSYLFRGLSKTRMWREFHMLQELYRLGLPVPRPIATRCVRHLGLRYSGDLITQTITNSETVAQRLMHSPMSDSLWHNLGRTIARFHHAGAYHADLNAHNMMLDQQQQFYLIDFDKGEMRVADGAPWQQHNLARLLRSFRKQKRRAPQLHFQQRHWQLLMHGYNSISD